MRRDDSQSSVEVSAEEPMVAADFDRRRREVLARLGRAAGYAAPVTVAMMSMKANACSMTC